jgi:hypothetical protein
MARWRLEPTTILRNDPDVQQSRALLHQLYGDMT